MPGARPAGFTLTELAVVLAIVGLLMGSLTLTLSAQVDQRNRSETQRRLEDARELLLGFAIVNGRLPCPARTAATTSPATTAGDEVRDSSTGQCIGDSVADTYGGTIATGVTGGLLPARAIGFQNVDSSGFAVDAWGNRIRYAVSATTWTANSSYTVRYTTQHLSTTTAWSVTQAPADLVVCSAASSGTSCNSGESVTNQNTVVAIVCSIGKNGANGSGGTNEAENVDGDAVFVSRAQDPSTATGGEFDDQALWIPVGLLYGRLIAAGVLP